MNFKKSLLLLTIFMLVFSAVPFVGAQDDMPSIDSVCLITDVGQVMDGNFNQFAYEGMLAAAEQYDLESSFIETAAPTDFENNINTCVQEGFDVIVTVGFIIADATLAAAEANPDVYFIGVDQGFEDGPENLVGIQYREDQAGFLVGALAALTAIEMTEEPYIVAGVYGIDVPPVVKFRHGYEQGAQYIADEYGVEVETLGVYIDSFVAPDRGASAAAQFIGEGADVIFGAGGQTGSGGTLYAAEQGIYVIGVDQDEYYTTFGEGETEGAEYLISSAIKRVDVGVYDMLATLVEGDMESWPAGSIYVLDVVNEGIGFAGPHDSDIPEDLYTIVNTIALMLAEGELETGVDPVTGEMLDGDMMEDDMGDDEDMDEEDAEEMEMEATEEPGS